MLLVGLLLARGVRHASTKVPLKTVTVAYQNGGIATVTCVKLAIILTTVRSNLAEFALSQYGKLLH